MGGNGPFLFLWGIMAKKPLSAKVDYKQLELLCSFGLTDVQLAQFYGVCERTINYWKDNRLFMSAMKRGKDHADEQVEDALYRRALGYSHPEEKIFCHEGEIIRALTNRQYPPDTTACIFWLKNRKKETWRDKETFRDSEIPEINIFIKNEQTVGDNGNGNGNGKSSRTKTTVQRFRVDGKTKFSLPDTL